MINAYQEIETQLNTHELLISDIVWVGTAKYHLPIASFLENAKKTYYDQESGIPEVAIDLVIVGLDWFLRRFRNEDGAERWEFIKIPVQPKVEREDITKLSIRECLDSKGFRKYQGSMYLEELNTLDKPEVYETPKKLSE